MPPVTLINFGNAFLLRLLRLSVGGLLMLAVPGHAGTKDPQRLFTEVDGTRHPLPGRGDCRALVLLFIAHDCPMSNGYAPEITRLFKEFSPQGTAFRMVYAERGLSPADAAQHAKEFALPCPAILDRDLRLAALVGATLTPQAAVLSPDGAVLYLGRIDDLYADYSRKRLQPRHRELRDAIIAVLAGTKVAPASLPGLGCQIDFGHQPSAKK